MLLAEINGMKTRFLVFASLLAIALGVLSACTGSEPPQAEAPADEQVDASSGDVAEGQGQLEIRANGEDFVRQGFVTKDGWQVSFDNLYVTLADVTAYQTEPAYDPDADSELQADAEVSLDQPVTVDLAEGDETAEPVLAGQLDAPAGQYNALAWKMVPASDGPAAGYSIVMIGTATKDGQTVDFNINIDQEYDYTCGAFVGDERKGILEDGSMADLEATFHFDHVFGDGEAPADDPINTGAVGFEPLAVLAENNQLDVDLATLQSELPADEYETLKEALIGLGHVGEGHCKETQASAA